MYSACEISWKFGTCVGSHYSESFTTYNHKCCQKPGNYTLECNDLGRDGWEGGYIQIGGSPTKYCRDWDDNVLDTKVQLHKKHNNSKVCATIKLNTKDYGEEISWRFGSCRSQQNLQKLNLKTYQSYESYEFECCQPRGNYTLECIDKTGDGWHGGHIQIGDSETKYCRDWHGHNITENIIHKAEQKLQHKVCTTLQIKTKQNAKDISWTFGSCQSNTTYKNYHTYQEDCCQLPGTYTLTCIDSGGKRDPRRWGAPAFK